MASLEGEGVHHFIWTFKMYRLAPLLDLSVSCEYEKNVTLQFQAPAMLYLSRHNSVLLSAGNIHFDKCLLG